MPLRAAPPMVALGVGVGEGVINMLLHRHANTTGGTVPKHWATAYRLLAVGAGLGGELWWNWDPDIDYALITTGVGLIASDVPPALSGGGTAAFGHVLDDAEADHHDHAGGLVCSSCAHRAAAAGLSSEPQALVTPPASLFGYTPPL